jgi:hypothetical protein
MSYAQHLEHWLEQAELVLTDWQRAFLASYAQHLEHWLEQAELADALRLYPAKQAVRERRGAHCGYFDHQPPAGSSRQLALEFDGEAFRYVLVPKEATTMNAPDQTSAETPDVQADATADTQDSAQSTDSQDDEADSQEGPDSTSEVAPEIC